MLLRGFSNFKGIGSPNEPTKSWNWKKTRIWNPPRGRKQLKGGGTDSSQKKGREKRIRGGKLGVGLEV